jgi:hypothetical protein
MSLHSDNSEETRRLIAPLVAFDQVSEAELNECLTRWGHKMGPVSRPAKGWAHGLFGDGRIIAVVATETLIRETCAGFSRDEAVELARVCAERRDLNRVVLRLWREFVFPRLARVHGYQWAVSYQDAALHSGDLYRFDGWVRIGASRSGTDKRTGRKGRNKVIWGWTPDAATRRARELQP